MSGLFGSKAEKPKVEPPARMPDEEAPEAKEIRRQKLAEMRMRGGRESTILTQELSNTTGKLGA